MLVYYLKYTMYMQINDGFAKIYHNKLILFNPDLHHNASSNKMYCIIQATNNKWKIKDIVPLNIVSTTYKIATNDLPLSSRAKHSFTSQLDKNLLLTHSIINGLSLRNMSFVKNKSNKILPVKSMIINQLKQFIGTKMHLTPIVRFKRNVHWLEHILICQDPQQTINFGVSFKCDNDNWTITSVFLNQIDIKRQNMLTGIQQYTNL
eukprot:324976_1